ncbi:unnamed protein product [Phytophthora lilii]|uniref:Unnamed protein product n=1 Tax=Phytophthora lilii TaxID=2077276 RepID=A0A9W6TSH9_9STRA|nr:unnamed protein product [Phytophthora lilii]
MQLATAGGATDRGTIEDESGPRSDDPRSSSPLQLGLEGDSANPAMSSSYGSDEGEIDEKPEPFRAQDGEAIEHDVTAAPVQGSNIKPKLNPKLITIEKFSGAIRDGYLDAGAYEWLEHLKDNIADAETFNDRTWPEQAKCSALTSSLIGRASTWYLRNWDVLPRASFHDLGKAFFD